MNINGYTFAGEFLWNHVECVVVACGAHNGYVRVTAGAYANAREGGCATSCASVIPVGTCTIKLA